MIHFLLGTGAWIAIGVVAVIVILIIVIIAWFVNTYNKLVKGRNRVENSWAQIDVQLKGDSI